MIVGRSTAVVFESGMLLSKEMLIHLEHLTHLNELQYGAYPDGIIYGLELYEENDRPFFSTGLVKAGGECYYIETPIDVFELFDAADEERESGTVRSAIILAPCGIENINEGICSKCLSVSLVNQSDAKGIILAEFQYSKGNRNWDLTADLQTQLNTTGKSFSFLNVSYSLPHETVFSPCIYDLMKTRLDDLSSPSVEDIALLLTMSHNRIISFDVLRKWFRYKKINVDLDDRSQIIELFLAETSHQKRKNDRYTPPSPAETPRPPKTFGM